MSWTFVKPANPVGVFAQALEVEGAVDRDVVEAPALAALDLALDSLVDRIEVLVLFEAMVADAFGGRADRLAVSAFAVPPGDEHSGVHALHLPLLVLGVCLLSRAYLFAERLGVLPVVQLVVDVRVEVVVLVNHGGSPGF